MFNLYFIPYSISQIKPTAITNLTKMSNLKNMIQILIIDDHDFVYLDSLIKREFRIRQKSDITDLNDVMAYDIILCDIRGVGKFLNSKYEGANLIKELKTQYPNKYIIAYTADEYKADFEVFLDSADRKVEKGALDLEDWVSMLEKALLELSSPVDLWKKTRERLLKDNVSTVDVARYESKYVKALNDGSYESFDKLCKMRGHDGAAILIELASSVIAKLLKP